MLATTAGEKREDKRNSPFQGKSRSVTRRFDIERINKNGDLTQMIDKEFLPSLPIRLLFILAAEFPSLLSNVRVAVVAFSSASPFSANFHSKHNLVPSVHRVTTTTINSPVTKSPSFTMVIIRGKVASTNDAKAKVAFRSTYR